MTRCARHPRCRLPERSPRSGARRTSRAKTATRPIVSTATLTPFPNLNSEDAPMIAEFLNREVVLAELGRVEARLKADLEEAARGGPAVAADEAALAQVLQQTIEKEKAQPSGQLGFEPPKSERRAVGKRPAPLDDFVFLSRDPLVSIAQSALEEVALETNGAVAQDAPSDDERRGPGQDSVITSQKLAHATVPPRSPTGRRLFNKFSVTDARWVRSL